VLDLQSLVIKFPEKSTLVLKHVEVGTYHKMCFILFYSVHFVGENIECVTVSWSVLEHPASHSALIGKPKRYQFQMPD